jgi:hypothetical protein
MRQKRQDTCTCHVGWNWENGPCDYCQSEFCFKCDHDIEECPSYCFCECNDNVEDDEDDEETV